MLFRSNRIIATMSGTFKVLIEEEMKHHRRFFQGKGQEDAEAVQTNTEATKKAYDENRALLKELLGHSPLEVLGGLILGVAVALLFPA